MRVHLFLALTAVLALAGCMKVGPDFHRPDLAAEVPNAFQHDDTDSGKGLETEDHWWQVFGDPELDRLVNEVLSNSWDIKGATARILEVRSQLTQTRADRFPTLNIDGTAEKRQRPIIGIVPGESFTTKTDTYTLALPASFELDLWGRLARAEEAARADLLQAEENRRTVVQTVVAETVNLYLQMESLERRIQIALESIENFRHSLALVESRYKRGLTSVLDVRQARRILAGAEALLPPLREELGGTQQQLSVLLGRYPDTQPPRMQPEDYFTQLAPVPPGLPSELLLRRPDLRAAEAGLMALNAQVGVAKASRFPTITLTGSYGYSSDELDRLVRRQSELWHLAMGIGQPLFDAGKLKAGQEAAQARYEQAVAEYAKSVLTAFSEVEKALLTRKEQSERRDRQLKFLLEARATQDVAEKRYRRGLVDYLTVLEAQRTRFQAEESLVLVDLAILTNRVALHRALGGGWGELTGEEG
ncbi:MAG: efflux transporter outer membrane subunit [Thermodesulfobacteriota bacterium]|nr:efflux transporter outer membrane subunit [Thermodesulfobacteriota bacterium]